MYITSPKTPCKLERSLKPNNKRSIFLRTENKRELSLKTENKSELSIRFDDKRDSSVHIERNRNSEPKIFYRRNLISSKQGNRKEIVDSIIKACESNGKYDKNSINLKKSIGKDRVVANKFAKDIIWVSRKLSELSDYPPDLMNHLYQESKYSNELHEEFKLSAYKKHNNKSLKDYKEKAKMIKNLLSRYRNREFN